MSMSRREWFGCAVGAALALGADRKLRIVVTGGHPGDPEYGCGGTVARYTDLGHEVMLLYMNRGENHRPPPRQTRARRFAYPRRKTLAAF